ncbi:hypothetical protein LR48_Vigan02g101300 [Vigna angularis]|uniref:Uncharacterized protein n=1 Tax=Phaseolus angularis TaxID=3914 RepID=A0A0L9TW96_PHAAN|nr:hypothetical protein LR48_Vigan02g101300 [Vigna angularis]
MAKTINTDPGSPTRTQRRKLRSEDGGSDIRSTSREGRGDIGRRNPSHPKHLAPIVGPCSFKNLMVTTRNMSTDDLIEMIRMLQQKMDEMQQRHEDELAAVKVIVKPG